MLNYDKLEILIINKYLLNKDFVKPFVKHFLGGNYVINLSDIKYKDIQKILMKEYIIELTCGCDKSAKVKFVENKLTIEFYNMGQEGETLSVIISFDLDKSHINYKISIVEFMEDNSFICSEINGFAYKYVVRSLNSIGYQINTLVNYYNPSDSKYFDKDDRENLKIFNRDNLERACFSSDYCIDNNKKSENLLSDSEDFLEFIAAREALDKKIEEGKNAIKTQQLVKRD